MLVHLAEHKKHHDPRKMPAFLQRRMDEFYIDRMQDLWGGKHIMQGLHAGAEAIQLVSNDYLSLINHPEILRAQVEALEAAGKEVVMSGVFLHGDNPTSRFERRMAAFCGFEAGILCQSGYAANVGLLQALAEPDVPVYIDMNAHASLWEGIVSAGAVPRPFRHNDLEHLERQLSRYGQGILCVDSVYSVSGSVAQLEKLVELAEKHECLIIVDESHSLGTHGPRGCGLVRALGLQDRVQFVTASLAKAFAGRAGIILCPEPFREYFRFTARPAIFSSSLLNHEVAALDKTLDIIQRDEWRRERLRRNASFLRERLDELGYNVAVSQSQIVPIEAGPEDRTLFLREVLEQRGVFGSVFCAPATPRKRSVIRLSLNAGLTIEQLLRVVGVFAEIRDEVGMWNWASTQRKERREKSLAAVGGI